MPREKYTEESQKYGRSPFTFEIEKDEQVLFYFGANHSHDSANHQYSLLRKYWNQFISRTRGVNRMVLVEGSLRPIRKSEEEAIKQGGEGSLITFFADRENVEVVCPDIHTGEFIKSRSDIDIDAWLLLSFLRWFNNYSSGGLENYKEEAGKWIKQRKIKPEFSNTDVSLENISRLYMKYIGKEFDVNKSQNSLISPNRNDAITNKLARLHSDLREVKIVETIVRHWNEGKSIFVVFGSGHLIIQRPALEELLK